VRRRTIALILAGGAGVLARRKIATIAVIGASAALGAADVIRGRRSPGIALVRFRREHGGCGEAVKLISAQAGGRHLVGYWCEAHGEGAALGGGRAARLVREDVLTEADRARVEAGAAEDLEAVIYAGEVMPSGQADGP
jgi:hypothetical protein